MQANIISIASGKVKTYTKNTNEFLSAYKKDIFYKTVKVNEFGIIEDEQASKEFHGGIDGALHICSYKHFKKYEELHAKTLDKLSFGCNIFIDTLEEKDVNVADRYSIGDVLIEVCQPRQACWKVGAIFDKELSRYILKYHATGWYARVLKSGTLDINNKMLLEKRVSELNIKELNEYLVNPPKDADKIKEVLDTKELALSYIKDFKKAIEKQNNKK